MTDSSAPKRQTCFYEVLGVNRKATDEEIRKAYKARALEWHPDKHPPESRPAFEEKFKELRRAYTVLMDADQRSWYDSHRNSILSGRRTTEDGLGGADEDGDLEEEEEGVDVWAYFSSSCYRGFDDPGDPRCFFNVYAGVFSEVDSCDMEEEEGGEGRARPGFGGAESGWEEVREFYEEWRSFCTKRSFSSRDRYNRCEAPDRRTKRAVDKENSKLREKARKEYNERIRHLAEFVYKSDPRVKRHKEEVAAREAARKTEEARVKEEKAALRRAMKEERMRQTEEEEEEEDVEAAVTREDEGNTRMDRALEEEALREAMETMYCVVCDQWFKNEQQKRSHEGSKKHKAAMKEMGLEEEEEDKEEEGVAEEGRKKPKTKAEKKKSRDIARKQKQQDEDDKEGDDEEERGGDEEGGDSTKTPKAEPKDKKDRREERRAKREERKARQAGKHLSTMAAAAAAPPGSLFCNTCGAPFPTRNSLFKHLKETGHALHVE